MKNTKRLVYGILSSLLLAVGFVRMADKLDPVLKGGASPDKSAMRVADNCSINTDIYLS